MCVCVMYLITLDKAYCVSLNCLFVIWHLFLTPPIFLFRVYCIIFLVINFISNSSYFFRLFWVLCLLTVQERVAAANTHNSASFFKFYYLISYNTKLILPMGAVRFNRAKGERSTSLIPSSHTGLVSSVRTMTEIYGNRLPSTKYQNRITI